MTARVRWLSAPFQYVGTRTIAVYVAHAMLLAVLVPLVPVGVVAPVIVAVTLTAIGVCVPLVLYRILGPLGGVFSLPHSAERRLTAWVARETAARSHSGGQRRGTAVRPSPESASSQIRSTRGNTASAE